METERTTKREMALIGASGPHQHFFLAHCPIVKSSCSRLSSTNLQAQANQSKTASKVTMRLTFISFSLFLLIVPAYLASASALAVPLKKGPERLKPVAASPEQKNIPVSGPSILTTNYVSLNFSWLNGSRFGNVGSSGVFWSPRGNPMLWEFLRHESCKPDFCPGRCCLR